MADAFFNRNKDSFCVNVPPDGTPVNPKDGGQTPSCPTLPSDNPEWNVPQDDSGTTEYTGTPTGLTPLDPDEFVNPYMGTGLGGEIADDIVGGGTGSDDGSGGGGSGSGGGSGGGGGGSGGGGGDSCGGPDGSDDGGSSGEDPDDGGGTSGGGTTTIPPDDGSSDEPPDDGGSGGGGPSEDDGSDDDEDLIPYLPTKERIVEILHILSQDSGIVFKPNVSEDDFASDILNAIQNQKPVFELIEEMLEDRRKPECNPDVTPPTYPPLRAIITATVMEIIEKQEPFEYKPDYGCAHEMLSEWVDPPPDCTGCAGESSISSTVSSSTSKANSLAAELNALYSEFKASQNTGPTHKDEELPFILDWSLTDYYKSEKMSKQFSDYYGFMENAKCNIWASNDPKISLPGKYSFYDEIDQDLKTVKHESLKLLEQAKSVLKIVPWLYTTDPNRAREANRRARHLKKRIFKAIMAIPSMLDLWDGIGEWTTPYLTMNALDKSQLKLEMWGAYMGGTYFRPRVVRKSVTAKNFHVDEDTTQSCYDTVNDFMQYCIGNAYMYDEKVENGSWYELTTSYRTRNMYWTGEKTKPDMYFHTIIQRMANPWYAACGIIGLSRYLIEYIVPKVEIVEIETYDRNTLIDGKRQAYVDIRGHKRVQPFNRLDRSGLDVIEDE